MLKKVQVWLNSLRAYSFFSKEKTVKTNSESLNIPTIIDDKEKIVRSIFSPVNVNIKTNKLRPNSFRSPAGIDEVSVNRLDFSNANFCKNISKEIENPSNKRTYFGLAVLIAKEIRDLKANVVYSPIIEPEADINPYHSDIKVGYIKPKGQEAPAEINYIIQNLTNKARFYVDPDPTSNEWEGSELL